MTTLVLLRHGLTAITGPVLAGRTPGVHLDDRGIAQAAEAAKRLAGVNLAAIVSSPLERCQETAEAVAVANGMSVETEPRLVECGYGDWTGQELKKLAKEPLWKVVQGHPSAARFPGPEGESIADMSARAVAAVREWNTLIAAEHGPEAVWARSSRSERVQSS